MAPKSVQKASSAPGTTSSTPATTANTSNQATPSSTDVPWERQYGSYLNRLRTSHANWVGHEAPPSSFNFAAEQAQNLKHSTQPRPSSEPPSSTTSPPSGTGRGLSVSDLLNSLSSGNKSQPSRRQPRARTSSREDKPETPSSSSVLPTWQEESDSPRRSLRLKQDAHQPQPSPGQSQAKRPRQRLYVLSLKAWSIYG